MKNILLISCFITFPVASLMAQPLQNELAELTKSLNNLADTLQNTTPETSLECLPNEMIEVILNIPKQFSDEETMFHTIASSIALVSSSKRLHEFRDHVIKRLSQAIKSTGDFSPNYQQFVENEKKRRAELRRSTRPSAFDQYKIINLALLQAFNENNFTVAKILVENGADTNVQYSTPFHTIDTLLIRAIQENKPDWVKFILQFIKNTEDAKNILNARGTKPVSYETITPLSIAIDNENIEIIKLLITAAYAHQLASIQGTGYSTRSIPEKIYRVINQFLKDKNYNLQIY